MRFLNKSILVMFCFLISGCATIFSGKDQKIFVDSNVQGADVYVNGEKVGTTPFTQSIRRGRDTFIEVRAKDYESERVKLKTVGTIGLYVDYVLAISVTGSTSATIDYAKGSAYEYNPNFYFFDLVKKSSEGDTTEDSRIHRALRHFLFTQKNALQNEIAAGSGEVLEASYALLGVRTQTQKRQTLSEMRFFIDKDYLAFVRHFSRRILSQTGV